jgi:hypothetical protein
MTSHYYGAPRGLGFRAFRRAAFVLAGDVIFPPLRPVHAGQRRTTWGCVGQVGGVMRATAAPAADAEYSRP